MYFRKARLDETKSRYMGQYLLGEIWAQEWRYFNNISHLGAQKSPILREYKI